MVKGQSKSKIGRCGVAHLNETVDDVRPQFASRAVAATH